MSPRTPPSSIRRRYKREEPTQDRRHLPGANLGQHTVWLNGMYGLSDAVAIDFRVGAARSYFAPNIPPTDGRDNYSGVTDTNIGVTWRIADELVNPSLPSIALRGGAIIEGSYAAGCYQFHRRRSKRPGSVGPRRQILRGPVRRIRRSRVPRPRRGRPVRRLRECVGRRAGGQHRT